MTRSFCILLLACGGAWWSAASEPVLRLGGSLQGEVRPRPELPALPWQLDFSGTTAAVGAATVTVLTPAGPVRVQVARTVDGSTTWRLDPETVELAAVQAWLRPLLPDGADLRLDGPVQFSGEGTWSGADGVEGHLQLGWNAEAVAWPEHDVELRALALTAKLVLRDSALAQVDVALRWDVARVASTPLGSGELKVTQNEAGTWWLEHATLRVWQGEVKLVPFAFDPAAPRLRTTVAVVNVALDELAPYFADALTAARGRLSGGFAVDWDPLNGLRVGRGLLQVLNSEVAQVKLAASPGLLSGNVPATLDLLPTWLGPLARFGRVENPAYQELEDVELGRRFIQVDELQIDLQPEGADGGTSARLHLVGKPVDSPLVEKVEFTVNVTGPLQEFAELMLDRRSRIGGAKN